ncbi:hypothetical protein T05_6574 [Trichinella murrelli]|uniref:Uncharacterized protein n=1 Tax=Trichinella murrelli TaxID=144512 RepID=A0A0V0T927_9BILA|nr:hypothetical protein T05_6574 [Trichinella murrelli]
MTKKFIINLTNINHVAQSELNSTEMHILTREASAISSQPSDDSLTVRGTRIATSTNSGVRTSERLHRQLQ